MIAKRGRCPGNTQGGGLFSFVRGIDQRTHQHEQVPGHIDDRLLGSSGALLAEVRGVEFQTLVFRVSYVLQIGAK